MRVPADGRPGTQDDDQIGQNIRANLVGSSNEGNIFVQGQSVKALIDSGSMVTTISETFYNSLPDKPALKSIEDLGLKVSIADGSALKYLGYIECNIVIPFLSDFSIDVPVLVVHDTDFNLDCPVIIGTNIIRICKESCSSGDVFIPEEWKTAMCSITCQSFPVKSVNRKPIVIGPYETVLVKGVSRNLDTSITEAVTENLDHQNKVLVCPRVVNIANRSSTTVSVKVCNISAKPFTIRPKTHFCQLQEVKVVDNLVSDHESSGNSEEPKTDEINFNIDEANLTQEQILRAKQVLGNWNRIFSKGPNDIGRTDLVKHRIVLEDDKPFKQPYRRIPPGMYEEVRQHVKDMLDADVIRESDSPFSSNVVLVRKKDGSLRFCIDYRVLNSKTRKDAYMLPRFDDIIDSISGARFFTKLDLRSGYWQVEVEEQDKAKTAFSVGNLGFFECNRMSFGLTNAPATFQRLMEKCMGEMHLRECLIFLDDILIFSKTFEEHIQRLESVFSRLAEHNLKLKPSKCEFFKTSVSYLGHIVSEEGIGTDPEKISAVESWPAPTNVKELRQYLGFVGYYRRFIKDFAKLVQPLNNLLQGHVCEKSNSKSKKKKRVTHAPWSWGEKEQSAFETVKAALMKPPVLAFANYNEPFILHTDASGFGLGAILYQKQEGLERVIAYASRGLRPSEKNYPAHKREFLALKWAVTDKFADYLQGTKFEVVTDNNPLTYILTKAKLDATSQRWVASLANFDFSISYKSGKLHTDVDSLSRHPNLLSEEVKAVCSTLSVSVPLSETLNVSCPLSAEEDNSCEEFRHIDWKYEQSKDPTLARVVCLLDKGFHPRGKDLSSESREVQRFFRQWGRLKLKDGILFRIATIDNQSVSQLVLPLSHREYALQGLHDDVGHPGKEKSLWLARNRFYWPGLEKDMTCRIDNCGRCIRRKTPVRPSAELFPIQTTRPLELVCVDFLSLEKSKGGYEDILVITDHFTRYAQAIPCRNQKARTTAQALYEGFFRFFGFPERLHSDQGRNFDGKIIAEFCKIAGVKKTRTTPYHPMGNGSAERFNQTLLKMLGTLPNDQKPDWKSHIAPLVQAYNATRSDATGFSPHYLMFGSHPRLSVDAFLGISGDSQSGDYNAYSQKLRERLQSAYEVAAKVASKSGIQNKANFDKKVHSSKLEPGDRVLVRKVGLKGKNKLADKWEEQPYLIQSVSDNDIPVYHVQAEDGKGPVRVLHRNMLLPFNAISPENFPASRPARGPPKKRDTRMVSRNRGRGVPLVSEDPQTGESEESDTSSECGTPRYIIPQRRPRPRSPPNVSASVDQLDPDQSDFSISHSGSRDGSVGQSVNGGVSDAVVDRGTPGVVDGNSLPDMSVGAADVSAEPVLRRSERNKGPPDWYGQWVRAHVVTDPDEIFV